MRPARERFESIKQGFQHTELTVYDAWLNYFSLGGNADYSQVKGFLVNDGALEIGEQRVLAQSLNEVFIGEGFDHPVPYPDQ
jgi:hypothetical protein